MMTRVRLADISERWLLLYPGTDSRLHLGNEPTRLPEARVCNSRMQADFYSVYDSKVDATLAWYDSHLPTNAVCLAACVVTITACA